jgi:hypothetical protein
MIVGQIIIAAFCRNGETRRDWEADTRHLREPCPFASENLLHLAVAFRFARAKKINVFHGDVLSSEQK